jgi:predicted dehydrogenase
MIEPALERTRVALVGAGQMGRHHARVVSESDRAELVGIVDPHESANAVASMRHVPRFESIEELLRSRRPDLAIVAVPTAAHADAVSALLGAGVHVLVEKPIAGTVEEAVHMIQLAEEQGLILAVGHVERFNPAVRALRDKLRANELGRVFQVHARRLSPFPARVGDTGVTFDLATHDLDLMCELAGRPLRLSAETDRKAHRSHEDLLAAILRFESGAIGLLEVNWLTPTKVRQLTVTGERGTFVVDYLNQHLTLHENAHESESWSTLDIFDGVTEGNVIRFAIPRTEPLRAQFEAVIAAVEGVEIEYVDGAAGLRALRLALALIEAGASGEHVDLSV